MTRANETRCNFSPEELSAFALGEVENARAATLREHLAACDGCRRRLRAFKGLDAALAAIRGFDPPAGAVLLAWRAVAPLLRAPAEREIMTLPEVANFLRIGPEELQCVISDLPAFEVGGEVRVRRTRLIEWIEKREQAYLRSAIESEVAGIVAGIERIRS